MGTTTRKARRRRKPHNAKLLEYGSFSELIDLIGNEKRTALVGEEQVSMTRTERLFRLMLDRALQGNVREVTKLLQLMACNPAIAATYREETITVISGVFCNA